MKPTDPFRASLGAVLEHSLRFLENLDNAPVTATASLDTLRGRLARELTDEGAAPDHVVADLVQDVEGGILRSTGARFFAWVVGGVLPAALAADWLTSAWDQNAGIHVSGPAAGLVEEVAGGWLKDILGLPAGASFAFVTGCQMAHVTCLAAARHALLERRGWDVARRGLYGAPPIRILTSGERHGSIQRAVRLLGLGLDHVIELPATAQGQLAPEALERELDAGGASPTIVLLLAGDLSMGASDSFETVIPIAGRHGAWVHVDGAFGLWAAASPKYRHLVRGVEQADSWATDGHKWLNVPYDCGYAFVADPKAHRAAMSHREPYLQQHHEARDQMDWNPEWSRRARLFDIRGTAPTGTEGRCGAGGAVLRACAVPGAGDWPPARSGSALGADDQSGAGAISGCERRRLRIGSRLPHGRGDRQSSGGRRSVLWRHDVARAAGHARQRVQLADFGGRRGSGRRSGAAGSG